MGTLALERKALVLISVFVSASSLEDTLSGLKSPLSATGQKSSDRKNNCFQCREFVRPDYTSSLPASPMQYGLKRLGLAFCYMLIQVTSANQNLYICIVDKDETTNLTGDRIPLPPSKLASQ